MASWENHKLVGSGFGRVPTYTYQLDETGTLHTVARERVDYQDRVHIHSLYMQTLAESGLIWHGRVIVFAGMDLEQLPAKVSV